MAVVVGEAAVRLRPETSKFADEAERDVDSKLPGIAGKAAGFFAAAFAAVGIGAFLGNAISEATDLGENMSKVGVVFGASAGVIEDFASTAATALGQSENQALAAAGTFGSLFVGMGIGQEQAASMSTSMVTLASDMASFGNATPQEALDALRAGLIGEAEPLRRFGVMLDAAKIEAEAMRLGLVDANGEVSEAAKAQAVYSLAMAQTSIQQGDFERTSAGLANQQRIVKAQFTDLSTDIGGLFVPILGEAAASLTGGLMPALLRITDGAPALGQNLARVGEVMRLGFTDGNEAVNEATAGVEGAGFAVLQFAGFVGDLGMVMRESFIGGAGDSPLLDENSWRGLATNVGDVAHTIMGTLGPAFNMVGAAVGPALAQVTDAFSGAFGGGGGGGGVLALVGDALQVIGPLIADYIGRWAPVIAQVVTIIGTVLAQLAPIIAGIVAQIGPVLASLMPIVSQVAGIFATTLLTVLQALTPVIPPLVDAIGQVVSALAGGLLAAIGALAPVLPVLVGAIGQVVGVLAGALGPILTSLLPIFPVLAQVVAELAGMLAGALAEALGAIAPVLPVLAQALASVAGVIAGGLMQVLGALLPIIPPIVGALLQVAQALIGALMGALQAILPVLPSLIGALVQLVVGALTPLLPLLPVIASLFAAIITALAPLIPSVVQVITLLIQFAVAALGPVIAVLPIVAGLLGMLVGALGVVITIVVQVVGAFIGMAAAVIGLVTGFVSTLVRLYTGLWTGIANIVGGIAGVVTGVFHGIAGAVTGIVGGIVGAVTGAFHGMVNAARSVLSGIAGVVEGAFSGISGIVRSAINGVIRGINGSAIGGINLVIDGLNVVPGVNIPHVPRIPTLHSGGVFLAPDDGEGLALLRHDELVATPEQRLVADNLLRSLLAGDLAVPGAAPGTAGAPQVIIEQQITQQAGESGAALAARVTQGVVWNLNAGITHPPPVGADR